MKEPAALPDIGDKIRASLSVKYEAREKALAPCREVIRRSANAIRAVHREEYQEARKLLNSAKLLLDEIAQVLAGHADLFYAGFVHDAQKEYAEGMITLAFVTGKPTPAPESLGVEYPAYLHGLAEAVGELRRRLLDILRRGQTAQAEAILTAMDDIYAVLVTMDFPDSLTAGLRRTTDTVRGILEKTRGDLTLALSQRDLERTIQTFEKKLAASRRERSA